MIMCPACGSALLVGLCEWHRSCDACSYEGSVLEPHILHQSEGGDLDEVAREDALRNLRRVNFKRIGQWIRGLVRAQKNDASLPSLLDVGCAHGWFLQEMTDGFRVEGIEPDPNVANAAGRRGLPIRSGFFPDVLRDDETYDVIVFNDVLEHVPDVGATLDACFRHLNRDGILVVNAPDRAGFLYGVSKALLKMGSSSSFNRLWQEGFPSPHLHYFDTASMEAIAHRHGFRALEAHRLPSVSAAGLYSRIRYSKDSSVVGAIAMTALVGAAIPLFSVLPSDITVWFFRKR